VFDNVTNGVKAWLVKLFASAIDHTSRPEDRALAIRWLGQSRDVVASDASSIQKLRQLNALINSRTTITAIAKSVSEAASNYRKSSLPLSMKIALPATLAAIPLVGGQAAGIAAFGGALGVPVLLLVFLGTAGITSIIEAVVTSPEARTHIADIIDVIIKDERLRQTSAQMKAAMKEQPMDPTRFAMPPEEMALRRHLLSMGPFNFEQHSMSFFYRAGLEAWVTRKSNDFGVDGFAVHADGLVVVQCKRNSTEIKLDDQPFSNSRELLKNKMLIVATSSPRLILQRMRLHQPR
jgi:restriction system protein